MDHPTDAPVPDRPRRSWRARIVRAIVVGVAASVLLPSLLIIVYGLVPPPITPLMVIRLVQGEGLRKDWQSLDSISPHLARAAIASEDNRFCGHGGYDWIELKGELRELVKGRRPRGASTISMQVSKNLFLWPGRDPIRKVLEAWITWQLELWWDKRRIIEVYLNIAEMGPGIYGAEAAAQAWFEKPAAKLTRREAALIVAILPAPLRWSPARPSRLVQRRARAAELRVQQLGPLLDCVPPA